MAAKIKRPKLSVAIMTCGLLQHKINKNYGGALKTGFKNSSGDLIAFLDADGTYPPEYFPQMCKEVMNGADMVVASRMAGEKNESPMVRQVGNFMFANLVSLIGNRRVTDVASGMRVFRRTVLDQLYPLPDGLNFTPVMSVRAMHEEIKLVEVAVPHHEREGQSKLSVIRDGVRFLNAIIWTALTYNPVRILGLIGMTFIALAAVILASFVVARLGGTTEISNWGVFGIFGALALSVTGVSLFNLGAMFNYLVTLFQKAAHSPGFVGPAHVCQAARSAILVDRRSQRLARHRRWRRQPDFELQRLGFEPAVDVVGRWGRAHLDRRAVHRVLDCHARARRAQPA